MDDSAKRKMSDRSNTSLEGQPETKRTTKWQSLDFSRTPSENASAGEWGLFTITQLRIMNENMQELFKTADYSADQASEALQQISTVNQNFQKMNTRMSMLEAENEKLKQENSVLHEKLLSVECYNRRSNLVFEGIEEGLDETNSECRRKIREKVLENIPGLNPDDVKISRCHRLGKKRDGQHRGIICHFHWYGDREAIMHNKKHLPEHVYVREDLPDEYLDRRRRLRPVFKLAVNGRFKGKTTWRADKVVIDSIAYGVDDIDKLPPDLNPEKLSQKSNERNLVFFGINSKFSNFHPCKFRIDNVPYSCNEQYIASEKAGLFDDDEAQRKIMLEKSPYRMKAIAARLQNFDEEKWKSEAPAITKRGLLAKFSQNPQMKQALLATGELILAEAASDKLFGTGVHIAEPGALDEQTWVGYGIMGDALMAVRDALK